MRSPRRGDGLNIRQQWPSSCVLNSCFCLIQRQRRRHQTETWGGNSVAACGHCCPSNLTVPSPMASSVFLIFLELAFFFFFSISDGSGHHQVGDHDGWSSCLFYLLCQKVAAIGESQFQASINERQTTIFLVTILLHCSSFCVIPFATQANSLFQFWSFFCGLGKCTKIRTFYSSSEFAFSPIAISNKVSKPIIFVVLLVSLAGLLKRLRKCLKKRRDNIKASIYAQMLITREIAPIQETVGKVFFRFKSLSLDI